MAFINKHDTNGIKGLLSKGEFGFDDYAAGGDQGRVYVGNGTTNIPLATKYEVNAVSSGINAIASGTLPNGQPIVINSNGTVSACTTSTVNVPSSFGSEVSFNPGATSDICIVRVIDQKYAFIYSDYGNNQHGTIVLGTVVNNTISFGSEQVFRNAPVSNLSISLAEENKVIIAYVDNDNGYYGTIKIATLFDNAFAFGDSVIFNSGITQHVSINTLDTNKFAISYQDNINSEAGTTKIGFIDFIDGITFGNAIQFNSTTTTNIVTKTIALNKYVIIFTDVNNSNVGKAIIGLSSGYNITLGVSYTFAAVSTAFLTLEQIDTNNIVICYQDRTNAYYGAVTCGSINGTIITFPDTQVFNSAYSLDIAVSKLDTNKYIIAYRDSGNLNYGMARTGYFNNSTITFDPEYSFNEGNTSEIAVFPISTYRTIIAYRDISNSNFGTARIRQEDYSYVTTNLTNENFVGFSKGNFVNGETALISIVGSTVAKTGLTPGQKYYLTSNAVLSETPDNLSVYAGLALNSTTLLIKG